MRLKLLRSAWGLGEALTCRAPHTIEKLRAAGFHGLEASLSDMGSTPSDRRDFVRAARTGGLQLVLSAYSSWPNYEGPFDAQAKHAVHVRRLVSDIQEIAELHAMSNGLEGPTIIGINAHSGTDMWHEDRALDFFCAVNDQVCALAQEIPRLSHETHRGRVLCCPFITSRLLARLPGLRLTSDFSHWVLKTERLLDTAAECDMLEQIAPAVVHLHARLASPQVPQIEHVHAAHTAAARERFYAFWETVWQRRLDEGDAFVTATVEYGPREWGAGGNYVGYPPFDSEKPLDVLVAEASNALRERFVAWRRCRE